MFGVITNLSRPDEGNYIYRLLECVLFLKFGSVETSFWNKICHVAETMDFGAIFNLILDLLIELNCPDPSQIIMTFIAPSMHPNGWLVWAESDGGGLDHRSLVLVLKPEFYPGGPAAMERHLHVARWPVRFKRAGSRLLKFYYV
jgi:hypothetical protein